MEKQTVKNGYEVCREILTHDLRIFVNSRNAYKGDKEIKFPNRGAGIVLNN